MFAWVGIETSSRRASIAVRSSGGVQETRAFERDLSAERAHAADLLPCLEELLAQIELEPAAIAGIVIGTGPGSYTGLRVGIATALGLARGTGARLVALPSIEALAYGELAQGERALLVSNAHAGAFYTACYARGATGVKELMAPCVAPPAQVGEWIDAESGLVIADEAATEKLSLSERVGTRLRTGPVARAKALLELGLARFAREGATEPREIQPLYLRPFQAKKRRR